ncbi:cytochrome c biogenesis protein CcmA [Salmonella enterica subsp. enterica]|uniref:Cytochrome c biogenesis protein CcmA n=1 Tax=Salmonella enterica I TaxID=59201 RepID=A0A379WKF6_SALET|nr:cytochrome c biogenesis protein CcmA [Salmonella enterica subsp. enterica]
MCRSPALGRAAARVALARLWLTRAALWVLDEPFTAIDVNGVARLTRRMAAHTAQGGMVILTTHQPLPGPRTRPPPGADRRGGGAVMWRVFCLELRVAFRHGADIAGRCGSS